MQVENIELKIIKDSAGKETIEARVNGFSASYPGGTSIGRYEQKELNPEKSILNFRKIENRFLGNFDQKSFDSLLMQNIRKLGTGLTTPLSMAFFSANFRQKNTFPTLLANVFGGGSHAKSTVDIQEILVIPKEKTMPFMVKKINKMWKEVGQNIPKNISKKLTIENAWTADISNSHALELVADIAEKNNARIGLDIAASQLYHNGKYRWQGMRLDRKEFLQEILDIINSYNIFYIEDPAHENDPKAYAYLKNMTNALVCGDDLIVTDINRLRKYKSCINSVIVKPNQAGTITGCMGVVEYSKSHGIMPVVSHRSRSTKNTVISKLAMHVPLAKLGAAGYGLYRLEALAEMWNKSRKLRMTRIRKL